MNHRRRLTLAPPSWLSPSPASGIGSTRSGGSRFSYLGSSDSSEDENGTPSIAKVVALSVMPDEVTPAPLRSQRSKEDLVQDLWTEIRFPMSASRFWERGSASSTATAGERFCGSGCREQGAGGMMVRRRRRACLQGPWIPGRRHCR
jgi:hypothetical protein